MTTTYENYIGGQWVKPRKEKYSDVRNPYNQQLLARAAESDVEDVHHAIDVARSTFDHGTWSDMPPSERGEILWKLAQLVEKNAEKLARLESQNVGKTMKYARDSDLPFIIDNLKFFSQLGRVSHGITAGEYVDFHAKGHHKGLGTSMLRREPIGVIGAIVPWNYPLYIAIWKIAPALAAGNTMVVKPASATPLTLLEFCKLAEQAGLPKGVLNVVTGPGEVIGTALAKSPKVDMLALTGDTSTGKRVMELSAHTVKRLHLELGGKAPLIVLPDADVEAAAQGAVVGGLWNSGQDCTAVTRVYVPEKMHDAFVKRMVNIAQQFKLGDPSQEKTDMGPLISDRQRDRVERFVHSALQQGAKIACGGKRPKGKAVEKGFFYEPTILTHVQQQMRVCQEEIFGPVIAVLSYKKVEDAIEKANDVSYGLAASVWGSQISQCLKVAYRLKFGTVWINEHGVLTSEMPHGGFKQSGFGKDLSVYAFEEYTQLKHVYIDLTDMKRKPWHSTIYGEP